MQITTSLSTSRNLWIKAAFFCFAYIGVYGVNLPFASKWLKDMGFSYTMVGIIISTALFISVITSPIFANITDKIGKPKPLLVGLPLIGGICFYTLSSLPYIWMNVLGYIIALICLLALFPLGDNICVHILRQTKWSYGPLRSIGSLGFIFTVFIVAPILQNNPPNFFAKTLSLSMVFIAIAASLLPNISISKRPLTAIAPIFKQPIFITFLVANFLLVHSHSFIYTNGTNYWSDELNFTIKQISYIWGIAVFGEMIVMLIIAPFLIKINPIIGMLIASFCAIIRWSIFLFATSFPVILLTNSLHGFTFGLFQISAITWISQISPNGFSARGISLFTASVAMASASGSLYAGYLYQKMNANAFVIEIIYAIMATILVYFLLKQNKKLI